MTPKISAAQETIVIFDFDGTITKNDTMLHLTKWHFGSIKFHLGILKILPKILLYKIGIISNLQAKEAFLSHFFQGMDYKKFNEICREYSLTNIDKIIKNEARRKINFYNSQCYKMVIITASIANWVEPWARQNGFYDILASKVEVENDKLTGKIAGKNCYGIEKVNRFIAKYGAFKNYHTICFGDSKGDLEILKSSSESYYKKYE